MSVATGPFPSTFTTGFPGASTSPASGWQALLEITRENAQLAAAERDTPLTACPVDGTPLQAREGGGLYCPWDSTHPTTNRGW